ncbi:hypothetical protein AHiyo6_28440 [Arthrobacter sp. Hiyo6]|jgi:hypothetical protein|nr:hypothetical protein AHiyo6_28440 [Arthrobacter sp. Hiyo6]
MVVDDGLLIHPARTCPAAPAMLRPADSKQIHGDQ